MKKDSAPDTSCTRREIHQLSMSDGINVWDLILIHVKKTRRHCETRTEVSWFTTLSEIGRIDPEMNRSCWYDTCFVVVKNNPSCKNQCVQTCRQHVDIQHLSKLQSILDVHCIHPSMSDTLICDTAASSTPYYHEANELHCFRCKVFVEQSSTDSRATVVISVTTEKYMDFPSSREITCVSW